MLYSLIPVILLTAAAISLAAAMRRAFSELFAPVICTAILVLYSFYIFDMLPLGATVVTLGLIAAIICCAGPLLLSKEKRQFLLMTVQDKVFLLFLAAMVVYLLFSAGKIVNLWDSLRLWGAYPKALHTTGALQLGEESVLWANMQSYPPGMPLLCYYITSFSPVFPESSLYFCYSLFGCSMFLPLLKGAEKWGKRALYASFIGIIYIPWLISSLNDDFGQYYSSLFIDLPLGICAGYSFFLAFHKWETDTLHRIQLCLSCTCLALLKDSGSYIALCCIVGAGVNTLLRRDIRILMKRFLWLLASTLLFLCIRQTWKDATAIHAAANHLQLEFALPSVGNLARIAYRFLITPATSLLFPFGSISISLPAILLTIFFLKYLLCRCSERQLLKSALAEILVEALCYAGFFAGYCFVFMEKIQNGEYPSYSRYMATVLMSTLYVFSADCIFRHGAFITQILHRLRNVAHKEDPLGVFVRTAARICKIVLAASMVLFVAMTVISREHPGKQVYINAQKTAEKISTTIPTTQDGPYTDVYLVIPGIDDSAYRLHHRIYFELIDDMVRVRNHFYTQDITSPELGYDPDSFMTCLMTEGYEYVVVAWTNDELLDRFGTLFPNKGTDLIYKVDPETASLIPITQGEP